MIARRPLILGGAGLSALSIGLGRLARPAMAAALPVPASGALTFRLIRHEDNIGTHSVRFEQQGDTLTIRIDVEVLVKFGPIPLVRYTHHNLEVWENGRLDRIQAATDKNGTKLFVAAHRTEAGLSVVGSAAQTYIAPEDALPTTYWNMHMLSVPMIGTQDGMLVHPRVRDLGTDSVQLAGGSRIPASRYSLRGDLDLDLWYDETRTWAGMEFSVADGSVVHFERL